MKRWFAFAFFAALTVSLTAATVPSALAATPSSAAQSASSTGKSHGTFTVELTKPLDSKKLKEGDPVEAKLTGGITLPNGTPVARGAKVIGHVTESKARSKNDAQSSLGIVFDKIDMSGGKTLAITGVIQAFAPNPNPDQGEGVNYGGMNQTLQHSTPTAGGSSPVIPILSEDSVGVQGIKNLQLGSDGVFKSDQKTVKLDYGSQVVLRAQLASGS